MFSKNHHHKKQAGAFDLLKSARRFTTTAFIIGVAISGNAQNAKLDSLHALQDNRVLNQYPLSQNPATLAQAIYPQMGFAGFAAEYTTGNYKRPMQAQSITTLQGQTGGYRKLKGWTYNGYFSYNKTCETEVPWSGVMDPYEGNPFIWADSSSGSWERDGITANIAVATQQLFKKLTAALAIDYNISTGARRNDPKPFFRYRDIALRPGITMQIRGGQQIGITGEAGFAKEEAELGFYSKSNVLLYRLRGFGTFSKAPFVSGERKRVETRWKGGLHYAKAWKNYQLLIAATASQRDDEVSEGVSAPEVTGYFTGIKYSGEAALYKGTADKGASITATASLHDGYADDVIFRSESASFSKHLVAGNISFWNSNKVSASRWQASLMPSFSYINQTDQGTRTSWDVSVVSIIAHYKYRKQLSPQLHLQIAPSVGYVFPVDDYYTNSTANVITANLVFPDYQYHATTTKQFNLTAGVEFGRKGKSLVHSILLSSQNNLVAEWGSFSNRNHFKAIYSIFF